MADRNYKKKYEFQKNVISRQLKQIEDLKYQVVELESKCKEKDKIISSIDILKNELIENINDIKNKKDEYDKLVDELREMKNNMSKIVFKDRWKLIRFLMK